MKRVVSESLTLHAQSLIKCLEQYGWLSWMSMYPMNGVEDMDDREKLYEYGFDAACDVVAELITDTIARFNARCDEPWPRNVLPQIPPLPGIDREACRIWTIEELYDEHVRLLKPNELITGALNWYLSRFWEELVTIASDDDSHSLLIWYDRVEFHKALKSRKLCYLYVINPCEDLGKIAEGEKWADLVLPVAESPMGFFRQGDAWVLTDDISGYLLDPDDVHSDEDADTIEYYVFTMVVAIEVFRPLRLDNPMNFR